MIYTFWSIVYRSCKLLLLTYYKTRLLSLTMSVCKEHFNDPTIRMNVLSHYTNSLLSMQEVAEIAGITLHTAGAIVKSALLPAYFRRLKAVKYSVSKTGNRNPMKGRVPHNYRGDCKDGHGYWTRAVNGKRHFVHRIVFAEMLGIQVEDLPESLVVHHIDENPDNNCPENLAITTRRGHKAIHQRYLQTPEESRLRGMSLADGIRYVTSTH